MKKLICFSIFILAAVASAQTNRFPPINLSDGDPTGTSCTIPNSLVQSTTTGGIYGCVSGAYAPVPPDSSKLPLSGGTITGNLSVTGTVAATSGSFSGTVAAGTTVTTPQISNGAGGPPNVPTDASTPLQAAPLQQLDSALTTVASISSPAGATPALSACMASGSCQITLVGDSICEGTFQIAYEDSWAGRLLGRFQKAFPNISWNVTNLCLGGRSLANFSYYFPYIGTVAPDIKGNGYYRAPGGAGYPWPGGSTVGQNWFDAAAATNPDILFVHFGMNQTCTMSTVVYAANIANLKTGLATLSKIPDVVMVTNYLPTKFTAPYSTYQTCLVNVAAATRERSRQYGWPVIDAGRTFGLLRDGTDNVRTGSSLETGFNLLTGWLTYGTGAVTADAMTANTSYSTVRNRLAKDAVLTATITLPVATSPSAVGDIRYRLADTSSTFTGYDVQLIHGTGGNIGKDALAFSYNGSAIATSAYWTHTDVTIVRVRVQGGYHQMWANNSLVGSWWDYNALGAGYVSYSLSGVSPGDSTATISAVNTSYGMPSQGSPLLSEDQLLGVNDWGTNPNSTGGNAINHMGAYGHALIYGPLLDSFISGLSVPTSTAYGPASKVSWSGTVGGSMDVQIGRCNTGLLSLDHAANCDHGGSIQGASVLFDYINSTYGYKVNNTTVVPQTASGYTGSSSGKVSLVPGTEVFGVSTLSSGTVTVSNAAACTASATCVYKFTNCGKNSSTGIGTLSLGAVSAGTSFVISSLGPTGSVLTTDASTVCWQIN